MTQPPNIIIQHPQPASNGLGIAGFIISLIGWLSCGLLCPIGFILSAIGMRKEPRGMAIAGFVIGLLGSIGWAVVFAIFGFAFLAPCLVAVGASGLVHQRVQTISNINTAEMTVESYTMTHHELPQDADADTILSGVQDGWGRPLHYHRISDDTFEIRSAGPDGILDNSDDISQTHSIHVAPPETQPELK